MFGAFERMVAMRYLRARRREGFVSVIAGFSLLGIALGVATLIVVMAVMNGFRDELLERILGLNGHLSIYGAGRPLTQYEELAKKVQELPGVRQVTPTVEGQVMAASAEGAAGAVVRGIRPEDLKARPVLADGLKGDPQAFAGGDAVIVGDRLAERLGLGIGDRITLISPNGNVTAFGTVPRLRDYRIVATFNVGMFEYDNSFVYMPLPAAQLFFRLPGVVNQIDVVLQSAGRVDEVRSGIYRLSEGAVHVYDWQQGNAGFFEAIQVERNVMFLILTLIVLVAAFNIISSLIMLVKDKGGDIAILRTMGATRAMIMQIFFLSGASVGIIGTGLGVALGLAFAANIEEIRRFIERLTGMELFSAQIYFLSKLPARVDSGEVIAVVAMALGLSFAATVYPSWRASRLDPVEALRYE